MDIVGQSNPTGAILDAVVRAAPGKATRGVSGADPVDAP